MTEKQETHTLAVLVDNEAGVLAKIAGLFSARGYNIQSLTVAEVDAAAHLSRFTIKTTGTPRVIQQIKLQLEKLIPVHAVADLADSEAYFSREIILVKVLCNNEIKDKVKVISEDFGATVLDEKTDSMIVELVGEGEILKDFMTKLAPLGLIETVRSGAAGMALGSGVLGGA